MRNGPGKQKLPGAVFPPTHDPTNQLTLLRRHSALRHPHRRAALRRTDALKASWGKAAHADLERVTGPHRNLLAEEHNGFAERIGLHDSGLTNALGPGADRELKSGQ